MKLSREALTNLKSIVILVIVPLVLTTLFAAVYSRVYLEEIPLAVLDLDETNTSAQVIEAFEKSRGFSTVLDYRNEMDIEEDLLTGKVGAALIIPKDFEQGIRKQSSPSVLMMVDGASVYIGSNAYSYAATIIGTLNAGIKMQYLAGSNIQGTTPDQIVQTLGSDEHTLYIPDAGTFKYAFSSFLALFIQQTFLSSVAVLLIGMRRETRSGILTIAQRKTLIFQMAYFIVLTCIALISCLMLAHHIGGYPLRGKITHVLLMHMLFIFSIIPVVYLISLMFKRESSCVAVLMTLSVPVLMTSGYMWPALASPDHFVDIVSMIWPFSAYAIPMREIMLKGVGLAEVMPYIISAVKYILLWCSIAVVVQFIRHCLAIRRRKAEAAV